MNYALNLARDNRVLSVTYPQFAPTGAVVVGVLPDGDVSDYLYVDGQYVYDPMPEPKQPEVDVTTEDVLNALLGVTE